MEMKFKETNISEDFSRALAKQSILLGPQHAYRIANILFTGISKYLASVKNHNVPKGIIIRSLSNEFLAGAKVEYFANESDPGNLSAGRWDYTWTCYEEDMKGVETIDLSTNSTVLIYFTSAGQELYNLKFLGLDICITSMITILEMIIGWVKDNTSQTDPAVLVLENCFKAIGKVENGKIEMSIIPDGAMKVLIKDDSAIQE